MQFCLNAKDVRRARDVWSNSIHPVPLGALAHAAFMKEAHMMLIYSIASFSLLLDVSVNELHDSD